MNYGPIAVSLDIDFGILAVISLIAWKFGNANPLRVWRWAFTAFAAVVLVAAVFWFVSLPRYAAAGVGFLMFLAVFAGVLVDCANLQRQRNQEASKRS